MIIPNIWENNPNLPNHLSDMFLQGLWLGSRQARTAQLLRSRHHVLERGDHLHRKAPLCPRDVCV